MVRNRTSKATSEQMLAMAKKLIARNTDIATELKSEQFVVNNVVYNTALLATLVQMWEDISSGIKSGKIKATKAKGLTIPK